MRPRIALNCDVEARTGGGRELCFLYTDYLDAIYEAGGEPVILPPDPRALVSLDDCAGVLLTGGDDYVASVRDPDDPPPDTTWIHPRRESFDLALGRAVIERDLPVLGICAGFQLLVLLGGGRVIGDIATEVGTSVRHRRDRADEARPVHPLVWSGKGPSGFEEIPTGDDALRVVSHHHQGVGALPPGWHERAVAPDGVIEAAVGPGRWQFGVQWHPELSPRSGLGRAVVSAFIEAAAVGVER